MKTLSWACLLAFMVATAGCSTIGHNETFMLQYKKDLHDRYDKEGSEPAPHCAAEPDEKRPVSKEAKELALQSVYRSNLPLSVTDKYDTRAKCIRIRAGDPLNIIVNRIYVKDNGQRPWLLENSSDIAVVVTVDDGRSPEPKHVLVAYEQNVGSRVKLPLDDLLAYSTEAYADEPVRIEVTVLAMYSVRNQTYSQVLAAAAGIGAALSPAYAPAISKVSLVTEQLDDLKSKIRLQLGQSEFNRHKRQPEALSRLFSLYEDKNISENDKPAVLALIRDSLPPKALAESSGDLGKLKAWYEANKGRLVYDGVEGRYQIDESGQAGR
jgi:hypothetical protein